MKKYLLLLVMTVTACSSFGQSVAEDDVNLLKKEISVLKQQIGNQRSNYVIQQKIINSLQSELSKSNKEVDSLQSKVDGLTNALSSTEMKLGSDISKMNQTVEDNTANIKESISSKSLIGIFAMLALAILTGIGLHTLRKKVSDSDVAIDTVRIAQKKLEEESVKLDNQLISVLNNQINVQPVQAPQVAPDHSLVLKVADEITRIELNLSRMDPSVKGLKQLAKGVERIKNNYLSKGYEIADMLNKPYNEGMRINADFVLDENLEPGTRIITSITKPQVIYNGELIQKAIVTVTQNI